MTIADRAARRKVAVLAVCCLSLLLSVLDTTAVNVALPAIGHDLKAPVSGLQWTIDGYTLAIASFMLLAGATADRSGRRRVFQTGLAVFTMGSLACSMAPSLNWLIAFRVLQGLGASMLNPVSLSILTNTYTDPRGRARALGLWGATVGLSLTIGPVAGGLLVASTGWRSVFWINLPLGGAALVLSALLIPESRSPCVRRPDPIGQILTVTLLASLICAIIEGARHGYTNPLIIALLLIATSAAVALISYERHRDEPLLDPAFFRSVPFTGAFLTAVIAFLAMAGFLFLNTLRLQDELGYSALHAGLLITPMAAGAAITSPFSGRLTATRGPRPPLLAAGALITASALILITLTPTTPTALLLTAYLLFGLGFGLVNTPITHTAVAGMPPAQAGVSAAVATTGRQIGNCLGVAVLGSLVSTQGSDHVRGDLARADHLGWWVLAGCGILIAALGIVITTARATASAVRISAHFPEPALVPTVRLDTVESTPAEQGGGGSP